MDRKILLSEKDMPKAWYNVQADLPKPLAPVLHPGTKKPVGPQDLAPIFPMALIGQEVSTERWIEIPAPVQEVLALWRPTPLVRALNLEKKLGTPARIYYKNESVSPAGSHKPNTAVAQAYYNKMEGVRRLATETGAGQWGSALSFACTQFGLKCKVYMVRVSFEQKPYRKSLMRLWGADVVASPSRDTEAGRKVLAAGPELRRLARHRHQRGGRGRGDAPGHQVHARQRAQSRDAAPDGHRPGDAPAVGGRSGEKADIVIGCTGGGSNFAGLALPFIPEKLKSRPDMRFVAVEPTACPSLTKGPFRYDFGDTAGLTPLIKMYTLGHTFMPSGIHAGGLRYHGMAPIVSHLKNLGIIEAVAYPQNPVFEAAADVRDDRGHHRRRPESAHAVRAAIDEALICKQQNKSKCIVFNLSGHGHFDLAAYDAYLNGSLEDYEHPDEAIAEALRHVPVVE